MIFIKNISRKEFKAMNIIAKRYKKDK